MWIEGVAGVDDGAVFAAAGGGGQGGEHDAGSTGGGRAADFGEASARQTPGEGVKRRNAAGDHFWRWADFQARGGSD
ncbi:MAG TPA: hypothetical protein VMU05_18895 [Dongiaceae bacterium]|nr:hypothetical protein [Dongiaceae bacterium]